MSQGNRHWPVMHLPSPDGLKALCGRRVPLSLIDWVGTTCQDCYAEYRARRWAQAPR